MIMSIFDELKLQLKFTDEDDRNIENLIKEGHDVVQSHTGEFELEADSDGRRLVKEYVRFVWNGAGEHFYDSFFVQINGLRWKIINTEPPDVGGGFDD